MKTTRPAYNHVHSSSRFDRTAASLKKAVASYAAKCSIITLTEVARENREDALDLAGWGKVVGDKSGWDDCAILFRRDRWKKLHSESFNMGGTGRWAQIAVLEDLVTGERYVWASAHYPAHVEGSLSKRQRTKDTILWSAAVWGLKRRVNRLVRQFKAAGAFIAADWNINFKKLWARNLIKSIHPFWHNTWVAPYPASGTHRGGRIIDATLYRGDVKLVGKARLLPDDASSDHRPYIDTLS